MAEIADDHQGVIAEQLAEGYEYRGSVRTFRQKTEANINTDWAAYFERNRKNVQPSVDARAKAAKKLKAELEVSN